MLRIFLNCCKPKGHGKQNATLVALERNPKQKQGGKGEESRLQGSGGGCQVVKGGQPQQEAPEMDNEPHFSMMGWAMH